VIPDGSWAKSSHSNPNGACVEVAWLKSSYSQFNGACVEAASYRKSTRSQPANTACVEAGHGEGVIGARDTVQAGDPARIVVEFSTAAWREFLGRIKTESFTV